MVSFHKLMGMTRTRWTSWYLLPYRCRPFVLMEAKVGESCRWWTKSDADDKIIAVAAHDPSVNHYNNLEELPKHFFEELRHFFEEYKKLENKTVVVEEFGDKTTALKVIEEAISLYDETIFGINKAGAGMTVQTIILR